MKPKGDIDINYECNRTGLTAFAYACLQNTFNIAEILLKYGKEDKDYINKLEEKSILVLAVELKLNKAVDYLISPDINVNDSNLKEKLGISKEVVKD